MGPSNDGSLFRTQANTQFNSFQNPLPTLNMSGPGWGVDQSYLTPSYAAPYRPGNQEDPISSGRPGFFASASNQWNPFASNGYGKWQDPFLGQQQYREQFLPRAGDAGMWTAQNIGVGTAAFWLGGKAVSGMAKMGGFRSGWGMGASWGENLFSSTARGLMGRSLAASNIGGSMGMAGAAGMAGRAVGGLFGGLALPLMAAQGIVAAGDAAVFDPYSNQRVTGRSLRENFSGITFGGGESGNPYSGRGLSFGASNQIASQVTRSGFSNWSMSGKEISGISDLASRAGLLENVNPEQFAKQITSITKQVAIIAAVANDPDFRNSIEIMAKLKDAGVMSGQASSFMGTMGSHSSVAGISTKRMMSMATQGQFLYGANGLTPSLGLEQYAQSFSSFSAASRNGLVSPALLARMGGVAGATQSALTGVVNASQTPYNQILLSNQYLSGRGGTSGNIAGNLSSFGQSFAGDPLGMAGAMGLYGGAMRSAQASAKGILGSQDQVMDLARAHGMLNSDGTLDDTKAFLLFKDVMGMDQSQAEALTIQLRNSRDSGQHQNTLAGIRSQYATTRATIMDSSGAKGPVVLARARSALQNFGTSAMQIGHDKLTSGFGDLISAASDSSSSLVDQLNYGSIGNDKGLINTNDLAGIREKGGGRKYSMSGYENSVLAGFKGADYTEFFSTDSFMKSLGKGPSLSEVGLDWAGHLVREAWDAARYNPISAAVLGDKPDSTGVETYYRFFDDLKKAGITDSQILREYEQRQAGNSNTEIGRKMQDVLGTRRRESIDDAIRNSKSYKDFKESGMGTWEAFSGGKRIADSFLKEGLPIHFAGMAGDQRVDQTGNKTAIDLIRSAQVVRDKDISKQTELHNSSKISSSKYAQYVEMYSAQTNKTAAELQIRAAEMQLKAAGAESSSGSKDDGLLSQSRLERKGNEFVGMLKAVGIMK